MAETVEHHKVKRVYGRRMGRPMHKARLDVLETILPHRKVDESLLTERGDVGVEEIFSVPSSRGRSGVAGTGTHGIQKMDSGLRRNDDKGDDKGGGKKLHFEIGFGSGEHLHYIMGQFPDDHFIGAEPYINGMTAFLKAFDENVPDNFRVHMDDALMVLNSLKDASIDFLYILNPDPWPKSRHHKRRIVNPQNLEVFARVLKDGGVMLQTTDVDELAEWMVTQTVNCPHFEWTAERPQDWKAAPNGWMATRYENKGKDAGRSQTYLVYKRRPRS